MKVPLVDLKAQHATIRDEVMAAVEAVAEDQRFILGERVAQFEATFARLCGAGHAVGVASGTDALVIGLRALLRGAARYVIVPSLTFAATAEAVVLAGAQPMFADIDSARLTLAPEAVERAVRRVRERGGVVGAVVPVHLFGRCADVAAIREAAPGVPVLEDAAQAAGASLRGGAAGSLGDAAAFSFFPSKNLAAWGDGGAVTTSDDAIATHVRRLRVHGLEGGAHIEVGTNSRLDALQAAVLSVKAKHLPRWVRARRDAAARYRELFAKLGDRVALPADEPGHAYNVFAVRLPRRDECAARLAAAGVETKAYYSTPLHRQGAFSEYASDENDLFATDAAAREVLALPFFPEITPEQQAYVADQLARASA
jgi:dTDP-4-amino-4,6-dideoxygalactose transaminase